MRLTWTVHRLKPVGAALIVGYGVKTYLDMSYERHMAQMQATQREDNDRKQRNEQLEDIYGDRSSLSELEKACQFYEKK